MWVYEMESRLHQFNAILLWLGGVLCLVGAILTACGRIPTPTVAQPTQNVHGTETAIANRIFATMTASAKDTAQAQPSSTTIALPSPVPSLTSTVRPSQPTRPPFTVQPTAIPSLSPPTKIAYPVFPDGSLSANGQSAYQCPQEGVYEVVIRAKQMGVQSKLGFAAGLTFGAFDVGGGLLKFPSGGNVLVQTNSGVGGQDIDAGSDCANPGPDVYNGKIDLQYLVASGYKKMAIRFVRSTSDLSPMSQDVAIDFSKPGRWWLYFRAQ